MDEEESIIDVVEEDFEPRPILTTQQSTPLSPGRPPLTTSTTSTTTSTTDKIALLDHMEGMDLASRDLIASILAAEDSHDDNDNDDDSNEPPQRQHNSASRMTTSRKRKAIGGSTSAAAAATTTTATTASSARTKKAKRVASPQEQETTAAAGKAKEHARWTSREDRLLMEAVRPRTQALASSLPWKTISVAVGSRNATQCRNRYKTIMSKLLPKTHKTDPSIKTNSPKYTNASDEEPSSSPDMVTVRGDIVNVVVTSMGLPKVIRAMEERPTTKTQSCAPLDKDYLPTIQEEDEDQEGELVVVDDEEEYLPPVESQGGVAAMALEHEGYEDEEETDEEKSQKEELPVTEKEQILMEGTTSVRGAAERMEESHAHLVDLSNIIDPSLLDLDLQEDPFFLAQQHKRTRRVRANDGTWIDERELEGRTISHLPDPNGPPETRLTPAEKKQLKQARFNLVNFAHFSEEEQQLILDNLPPTVREIIEKDIQKRKANAEKKSSYNPFQLVACQKPDDLGDWKIPFVVHISSDVLFLVDIHAHMTKVEIIGLLGGKLDEKTGVLRVTSVFPCRSLPTATIDHSMAHIECEMDPMSELAAREHFQADGLQVVGWYHSHPTFSPSPSRRDIETQGTWQSMFASVHTETQNRSPIEPFLGIIVSPYNASFAKPTSTFEYIHLTEEHKSLESTAGT